MVGGGHTLMFGPGEYINQEFSCPPSGSAGSPTRFHSLNGLGTATIRATTDFGSSLS